MQALTIVELVNEVADACSGFFKGFVLVEVDLLVFERPDEALCFGVVIGIAAPAHADFYAGVLEGLDIGFRGILHAPVGVMHKPLLCWSGGKGAVEGVKGQPGIEGSIQSPADASSAMGVKYHCQIDPLAGQADVGDVGYPQLVNAGHVQSRDQVGVDGAVVIRVGGRYKGLAPQGKQVILAHETQDTLVVHVVSQTL